MGAIVLLAPHLFPIFYYSSQIPVNFSSHTSLEPGYSIASSFSLQLQVMPLGLLQLAPQWNPFSTPGISHT